MPPGRQGQPGPYGPPGQPSPQGQPYGSPGYGPPGRPSQPYGEPSRGAPEGAPPKKPKRRREPPPHREPAPPGPHPAEDLPLASIWRRAGARAIDGGLLGVLGFALVYPVMIAILGTGKSATDIQTEGGGVSGLTFFSLLMVIAGIPFLYEAVQLALWGQTLGKRVLSLRVVTADPPGEGLSVFRAVTRAAANNLAYWIGCPFVGTVVAYLWAFWDEPLQQAVHDKIAGTVVIDERFVDYEDSGEEETSAEDAAETRFMPNPGHE